MSFSRALVAPLVVALLVSFASGCRWRPDRDEFMRLVTPDIDRVAADDRALWQLADEEEKRFVESGLEYRDAALVAYVKSVVDRILPAKQRAASAAIRIHLVREREVVASAAPNGAIYLSVGLLALLENEAQLASVLGHELAHFLGRHSVVDHRVTASTPSTVARMRSSRLHERDADEVASWLVQDAGYDLAQFRRTFEILSMVEQRSDVDFAWLTHPVGARRMRIIDRIVEGRIGGKAPVAPYERAIMDLLLVSSELSLDGFEVEAAERTLDRYFTLRPDGPRAHFLRARQLTLADPRGEASPDVLAALERARAAGEVREHPELLRALAFAYRKVDRRRDAVEAFEAYLARVPDALDAPILRAYVERLSSDPP